jgi:hypothetical protein
MSRHSQLEELQSSRALTLLPTADEVINKDDVRAGPKGELAPKQHGSPVRPAAVARM